MYFPTGGKFDTEVFKNAASAMHACIQACGASFLPRCTIQTGFLQTINAKKGNFLLLGKVIKSATTKI
jgi:hypothetical protein